MLAGGSAAVDSEIMQAWLERLPSLLEGYERDIYNADQTGLFYVLPDRTLALEGESCNGGKNSKDRLTVLLCVNSDASDKEVPTVIGKSPKLRCFKNVKKLPTKYHTNNKAWMTRHFFFISAFIRRKYGCAKQEHSPLCGQLCRTSKGYIVSKKCKSHTVPGKLYKCTPAP
jgi:hypothetical protein